MNEVQRGRMVPLAEITLLPNIVVADEPSKADLKRFIECFDVLDRFEATQHKIRGYGAFDRTTTTMPDVAVMRVVTWLKGLAA